MNWTELNWTERLAKVWNLGNAKLQKRNCRQQTRRWEPKTILGHISNVCLSH